MQVVSTKNSPATFSGTFFLTSAIRSLLCFLERHLLDLRPVHLAAAEDRQFRHLEEVALRRNPEIGHALAAKLLPEGAHVEAIEGCVQHHEPFTACFVG